jgi:adenylosuccinate lyase
MERPQIFDVLADRYASTRMLNIWSPEAKIVFERQLWLAVLKDQHQFGLPHVTQEAINAYERHVEEIDFTSLRNRELVIKHDIKAKIEEFNALAEHELVHLGMTSRDLTDNVEQFQIRRSMELIRFKLIAVLARLIKRAQEYRELPMVGRSHNVPAQMIVLGKRFSGPAEELNRVLGRLCETLHTYPLRGIKGPMGTQQDMLDIYGKAEDVTDLEDAVATHLGFIKTYESVGQVYPRSLDFEVLSTLCQIGQVGSSFATTVRLMAGHGLITEGFKPGQVGSSAMPHKQNARSSERMCGFYNVLRGFLTMIEGPAGDQWNEGDVSCSIVRRVAIQGSFLAVDGLLETWMTILNDLGAYEEVIGREVEFYMPALATTKILMAATKVGMGREEAHAVIKRHTSGKQVTMRDLLKALGNDPDFAIGEEELEASIGSPLSLTGLATEQVDKVCREIEALVLNNPEAGAYTPEPIL